jgi:uncharacterized membrane protein
MPAIPLHTAVSYVAGAYLVFFALVLVYVAIMATKLSRIESELSELTDLAVRERESRAAAGADAAPTHTQASAPPAKPEAMQAPAAQAAAGPPDAPKTATKKTGAIAG